MKRRILLTIDCNAKTCGRCTFFTHNCGPTGWCEVWGYPEEYNERIPECIAAEEVAKTRSGKKAEITGFFPSLQAWHTPY
jgi:hypothetical protein